MECAKCFSFYFAIEDFHCRMPWLHSLWWFLWLCHIHFGMCCSRSSHILMTSPSVMLHILLWSKVKTFLGSVLKLKYDCNYSLLLEGTFLLVYRGFLHLVLLFIWISLPWRMVSLYIWSDIYLNFIFNFLDGISVLLVSGLDHDLYHQHHIPLLKCLLQCQIHLVDLWIFCWFFARSCHLLVLLQLVIWGVCTWQIDM